MALYAFDGTWNSEKDAGEYDRNTNVVRFKDLYAGTKFFYKGVGTKHGFLGKFAGGAFGVGGHDRIEDAKKDVAKQFAAGDRDIDIVGFSRGAALAVHFANVIADDGVSVNGVLERPAGALSGRVGRRCRVRHPDQSRASISIASTSATSSACRRA